MSIEHHFCGTRFVLCFRVGSELKSFWFVTLTTNYAKAANENETILKLLESFKWGGGLKPMAGFGCAYIHVFIQIAYNSSTSTWQLIEFICQIIMYLGQLHPKRNVVEWRSLHLMSTNAMKMIDQCRINIWNLPV